MDPIIPNEVEDEIAKLSLHERCITCGKFVPTHPRIHNALEDETAMVCLHERCITCGEFGPTRPEIWSKSLKADPQLFVGRNELLHKMDDMLYLDRSTILVCSGVGGVGKTALVRQYMYSRRHKYTCIAWFDATTTEILIHELACLVAHIRKAPVEEKDAVEEFKGIFYRSPPLEFLLIFDNVSCYADIIDFIPVMNCKTIIISRNGLWPFNYVKQLRVDTFSDLDCNEFLYRNLGTTIDVPTAAFAEAVNRFPLFLSAACSYIWNTEGENKTLGSFRNFILSPQNGYETTIISCFMQWKSTFDEIEKEWPTKFDFLKCWSVIGSETISFAVLKNLTMVIFKRAENENEEHHRFLVGRRLDAAISCFHHNALGKYNRADKTMTIPTIILNALYYFLSKIPGMIDDTFDKCKLLFEEIIVEPANQEEIKTHYEMLLVRNGK
jgi:hypothetical protein